MWLNYLKGWSLILLILLSNFSTRSANAGLEEICRNDEILHSLVRFLSPQDLMQLRRVSTKLLERVDNFFTPIKMGIELELQDIRWDMGSDITSHLRIFESSKKVLGMLDKPQWYLEVDGSGNIEFVSHHFYLPSIFSPLNEHPLYQSIGEMHMLMAHILKKSTLKKKSHLFIFEASKNKSYKHEKIQEIGTWTIKIPNSDLSSYTSDPSQQKIRILIKNIECKVRPQATFELPFSLISKFSSYMANKHPRLSLAIRKIQPNESGTSEENTKELAPQKGFIHLIKLYIMLLQSANESQETGPKGYLPLMSRRSFSSMYKDLSSKDFANEQMNLLEKEEGLFKTVYHVFREGRDVSCEAAMRQSIAHATVKDWIESIQHPIQGQAKRHTHETILSTVLSNYSPSSDVMCSDLLSPPPFLTPTYSMGRYNMDGNGERAIIEMRGYTALYKSDMRMGPLVFLWFTREAINAKKCWNSAGPLVTVEEYNKALDSLIKEVNQSEWKKGEIILQDIFNRVSPPLNSITQEESSLDLAVRIPRGLPSLDELYILNKGNILTLPSQEEWNSLSTQEDIKQWIYRNNLNFITTKKEWILMSISGSIKK